MTTTETQKEFVITRTFDAPRDLVWKAWTDPERMKQWWGPKGFDVFAAKMDLRPGGTYLYGLRSPEGQTMWGKFVFREILAPERLVFIVSFSDEQGGVTRHPMAPVWPLETLSTVIFSEQDGKTTVTVRWQPFTATEEERNAFEGGYESMRMGWGGTLDKLADYLPNA